MSGNEGSVWKPRYPSLYRVTKPPQTAFVLFDVGAGEQGSEKISLRELPDAAWKEGYILILRLALVPRCRDSSAQDDRVGKFR
jgi:hypothetical protein